MAPKKRGTKKGTKKKVAFVPAKRKARSRTGFSKVSRGSIGAKNFKSNDPFPPMCLKEMTYSAHGELAVTDPVSDTFSGTEYVWNLNSIFKPYVGSTTELDQKTYGYTEMSGLYNRYKVHGVLVEVQFFDPNTDGLVAGLLFDNPSNANGLSGNTIGDIERRPQGWTTVLANTGAQKTNFKQYYPMNVLFNLTRLQFKSDIDNTTSSVGSSPGSMPTLHMGILDTRARTATLTIEFTIRLTYFTQFYQRKQY